MFRYLVNVLVYVFTGRMWQVESRISSLLVSAGASPYLLGSFHSAWNHLGECGSACRKQLARAEFTADHRYHISPHIHDLDKERMLGLQCSFDFTRVPPHKNLITVPVKSITIMIEDKRLSSSPLDYSNSQAGLLTAKESITYLYNQIVEDNHYELCIVHSLMIELSIRGFRMVEGSNQAEKWCLIRDNEIVWIMVTRHWQT